MVSSDGKKTWFRWIFKDKGGLIMRLKKKKIKNTIKLLFTLIAVTLIFSNIVMAEVTIGGELKANVLGAYLDGGDITSDISESLDLELFIPSIGDTDFKLQFEISNPEKRDLSGIPRRINFKKLNLRHKFDDFHLTIGRQPISWSFGSILNPVDFTLGAVAMDQETISKYQDAVEIYYPINWNSSFAIIAADHKYSDDVKWGVRGRTGFQGYDLTLNYVKEPATNNPLSSILPIASLIDSGSEGQSVPMDRIGFTAKGDLGPIGAYASLGYYKLEGIEEPSYSYLFGGDYSFTYNYDKQIAIQAEYLALQDEDLINTLESNGFDKIGNTLDLFLGNISYPIDDFSSISLFTMTSLEDGSTVLIPVYENHLPGNIILSLSSNVFISDDEEMLSAHGIKAGYELSLSYAF